MNEINDDAHTSKKDGRNFLIILVSFFVCFITVDAFFIYKALSTHTGVVIENAYEVGLNYNDILEEARRRNNEPQP